MFIFSRAFSLLSIVFLCSCISKSQNAIHGYVESDPILISAPASGNINYMHVRRGDTVSRGTLLFSLDDENEIAASQQAQAMVKQAAAQEEDLNTGKREVEIQGLQAAHKAAEAAYIRAEKDLKRQSELVKDGFVSDGTLDAFVAQRDTSKENLTLAQTQIENGRLKARDGQRKSAHAVTDANIAQLKQKKWALDQKKIISPVDGFVKDIYYQVGEYVSPGSPILSLEGVNSYKIKFYVPEEYRSQIKIGGKVKFSCSGCVGDFSAKIVFLAKDAEFTPPVIFSKDMRAKLVWLVEAVPRNNSGELIILPGQVVDIALDDGN